MTTQVDPNRADKHTKHGSKPKATKSVTADYTFKQSCDSCGQKPALKDVGMCSVCTFGEADSMWEWLDDGVTQTERKATNKKIDATLQEMDEAGMIDDEGNIHPMAVMLMHFNQHVVDRIEELV